MSIDLSEETLLTMRAASKRLPGRPHVSTLWRWHARGIRGIHLETVLIGGRRYTSLESLARFAAATTAAAESRDGSRHVLEASEDVQDSAIRRAERQLDEAGI